MDMIHWVTSRLEAGVCYLLIDLQQVSFLDSNGLSALATAMRKTVAAGSRLALCSLSCQARMVLELSGMDRLFEIYSTATDYEAALEQELQSQGVG